MRLWPHQQRALDDIAFHREDGCGAILVTAPTGSGKSKVMECLLEQGEPCALYTDRRMLMEQLARGLRSAGFDFGIRAAGHEPNLFPDIQLCMVQTESRRVVELEARSHHPARVVILDEAHRLKADTMQGILELHAQDGATIIGFTATPLGLSHIYNRLIVAATNSECRACGAHVPAHTYAPSEVDVSDLKRQTTGEYEVGELRKRFSRPVVFGEVFRHWKRLNPDARPTLGFGPDVAGSQWFAEQFENQGVPAGHIDAKQVIIRGEQYESTEETRAQFIDELRAGRIVAWNRFVLREGIDIPELYHGIFATAFGALTSYIQAGGRLLRSHPSLSGVVIQDHGGNTNRHGSLNSDREWYLEDTEQTVRAKREDRLRSKSEPEPITCPECGKMRASGPRCMDCGHIASHKSRIVIQLNGELKEVRGDIYKPRRQSQEPQEIQDWKTCLFRCANARKRTLSFNQAMGLFAREHFGRWPNKEWPLVPQSKLDGMRKVTRETISEIARDSR